MIERDRSYSASRPARSLADLAIDSWCWYRANCVRLAHCLSCSPYCSRFSAALALATPSLAIAARASSSAAIALADSCSLIAASDSSLTRSWILAWRSTLLIAVAVARSASTMAACSWIRVGGLGWGSCGRSGTDGKPAGSVGSGIFSVAIAARVVCSCAIVAVSRARSWGRSLKIWPCLTWSPCLTNRSPGEVRVKLIRKFFGFWPFCCSPPVILRLGLSVFGPVAGPFGPIGSGPGPGPNNPPSPISPALNVAIISLMVSLALYLWLSIPPRSAFLTLCG